MRTAYLGLVLLLAAPAAAAQAPVEELSGREAAIQRSQQRAGAAFRELQQVRYQAKLAEQDYLNAEEANRAAQRQAEERKRELEAAKKALDAARAKEAQARKAYDEALTGVDKAWQKPPAKQK
ncbi:MAG: hypothetical protein HYU76_02840 [Betaproteobacteria bacterium]|nr:hypothetical protein [Betaproteobacteria bacterium]